MASEFVARARATWARLIRKVYEADPLECPKCKGPMRVIALIEDLGVIRRILEHLGCRPRPVRIAVVSKGGDAGLEIRSVMRSPGTFPHLFPAPRPGPA